MFLESAPTSNSIQSANLFESEIDEFTTSSVNVSDRLKTWQSVVRESCVPLSVKAIHNTPFEGSISSRDLGDLCFSMVQSVGHVASHEKSQISKIHDDFILASIQLSGEGVLDQNGCSEHLTVGDMVLYDSTKPFQWYFPTSFGQLVVRIPKDNFKFHSQIQNAQLSKKIPCKNGIGKISASYLMSLYKEAKVIEPNSAKSLTDSAVDMISSALNYYVLNQVIPQTNIHMLHLNQANSFISNNIRDPELVPEKIANAIGISVRYLHYIFNKNGNSVSKFILSKRLAACAKALQQKQFNNTSISTIAYYWGFNSAVHFSRVFKNEFGMSAREYRSEHN